MSSLDPDKRATTTIASVSTTPADAPAAINSCFFVAEFRRPASDTVPANVGCGMPITLDASLLNAEDCESAGGYDGSGAPSSCCNEVGGNEFVDVGAIGTRPAAACSKASAMSLADS